MGCKQQMISSHHFLLITTGVQGQINPARHLARHLVRLTGSRVTVATPLSSHRRMFPGQDTTDIVDQGLLSFAAYSDGFDDGFHVDSGEDELFVSQLKLDGTETLTGLARTLTDRGRPVTCIIYTILLAWAADVAIDLGIPSVLYWIQPASLFAIYHHYFHGFSELVSAHKDEPSFELSLPGLPTLRIKDLPSILLTGPTAYADAHGDIFRVLDREIETGGKPRVLVNTFRALEADAVEAMHKIQLDLVPIGPMMIDDKEKSTGRDLFEQDASEYMRWLDTKEDGSVVYVSFGSILRLSKRQMEEISEGLEEGGRPYLWVVRTYNRGGGGGGEGMIVEWCDQVKVLSHRSVECFMTHSGWNSTFESIVCGVPMVMMPQWLDQLTNARLVEEAWSVGVRGEAALNGDGVVEGREMEKCIEIVMGERGAEMRKKADMWKEKARKAAEEDGESVQSLVEFVKGI